MSDTENLNEAADSGLLQPRLVRHLFEGGSLRRWTADGPNENRDNFHDLRWMNGRFVVAGFAAAFLSGDACVIEVIKNPDEWEILPNAIAQTPPDSGTKDHG